MQTVNTKIENQNRILVVDDDPVTGSLIRRILTRAGFESIDVFTSPLEALNTLNLKQNPECPYAIIILDIIMPEINGFQFCEKIKANFPHIPVILISSLDTGQIQNKLLQCGADDFIMKPFDYCELTTRVSMLLAKTEDQVYLDTFIANYVNKRTPSKSIQIPYVGDKVDSYLIMDSIELGKFSIIYKVLDINSHDIKAMKILIAPSEQFNVTLQRFKSEIDIISRIDHPNVIRYFDKGEFRTFSYFVMEYLNGINLEQMIIAQGRISEEMLLNISIDLANAVCEIHRQGIIHRDIKLRNSIYNPITGRLKLCDFGIAQLHESQFITQEGTIIGTPIYMAPESFRGTRATRQSDIFSFGATIYHLATGTPPYVADNQSELYHQHFSNPPVSIEKLRPEFLNKWDILIIDQCLAPYPEKRPASMDIVLEQLQLIKQDLHHKSGWKMASGQ